MDKKFENSLSTVRDILSYARSHHKTEENIADILLTVNKIKSILKYEKLEVKRREAMKIIGIGNTATVYEWEEGKELKLFYGGYPQKSVEREFHNAGAIRNMDFAKPKAYEIVFCEERMGIIYDKI